MLTPDAGLFAKQFPAASWAGADAGSEAWAFGRPADPSPKVKSPRPAFSCDIWLDATRTPWEVDRSARTGPRLNDPRRGTLRRPLRFPWRGEPERRQRVLPTCCRVMPERPYRV